MSSVSFVSSAHVKAQVVHHLEWCPKYRYRMFQKERVIKACEASIRKSAQRHGMSVLELSVMPDHVHAVVQTRPSVSASRALMLLKGSSAYDLFREFPQLRLRYPKGHFWSRGSFVRSTGDSSLSTVRRYVREQNDPWQQKLVAI